MSKIPPNAQRVFEGVLFDVYQWPQKMFDGSTETFEILKRPDSLIVVALTADHRVVLIDEEQPDHKKGLGLPAGRHDKSGEDSLEGAKRELAEETGYTSTNWKLIFSVAPQPKIDWTLHYFLALDCKKTTDQALDSGEKIQVELLELDNFLEQATAPGIGLWDLDKLFLRAKLSPKKQAELKQYLLGKCDELPSGII